MSTEEQMLASLAKSFNVSLEDAKRIAISFLFDHSVTSYTVTSFVEFWKANNDWTERE